MGELLQFHSLDVVDSWLAAPLLYAARTERGGEDEATDTIDTSESQDDEQEYRESFVGRDVVQTVLEIMASGMAVALPSILLLFLLLMLAKARDRAPFLYGACVVEATAFCVVAPLWARCFSFTYSVSDAWPPPWMWTQSMAGLLPLLLIAVIMVRVYTQTVSHWYYIDREFCFFIAWASVTIFLFHVPWQFRRIARGDAQVQDLRQGIALFVFTPLRDQLIMVQWSILLLGASILRYKLLHDCKANPLLRYGIVLGGILIQFFTNRLFAGLFSCVQEQGIAVLRAKLGLRVLEHDSDIAGSVYLGKLRDWLGHGIAYSLAFMNKLLITGLQSWREALLFSLLMAVCETAETLYVFRNAATRLSELRELELELVYIKQGLGGKPSPELADALSKRGRVAEDQQVELVMLGIKHLTAQMLEYNITLTAVAAAVIFDGNKTVTGFSNGFWDVRTGFVFLLTQFIPEAMTDAIGLSILKRFGLDVRGLYREVHCDPCIFSLKAGIGCMLLPIVALAAQERLWGA